MKKNLVELWFENAAVVIYPEAEGEEAVEYSRVVLDRRLGEPEKPALWFDGYRCISDFLTQPVITNDGYRANGIFIPFEIEKGGLEWCCDILNGVKNGTRSFDEISFFNKK